MKAIQKKYHIPTELARRSKAVAALAGISESALVEWALTGYFIREAMRRPR